jgi:hypothetical protein
MRNACRRKKPKRVGRRKRNTNAHWNVHKEKLRKEGWWSKLMQSARRERPRPNELVARGGCGVPFQGEEDRGKHHPRRAQVRQYHFISHSHKSNHL